MINKNNVLVDYGYIICADVLYCNSEMVSHISVTEYKCYKAKWLMCVCDLSIMAEQHKVMSHESLQKFHVITSSIFADRVTIIIKYLLISDLPP